METTLSVERTSRCPKLCVSREIDAPVAAVWDVFVDTHRWPTWGPSVSAVDCDRRYVSDGTTGRIQVARGPWLPFQVRMAADRRWCWRVAGVPATGHRVTEIDDSRARATFELSLLAAWYAPVCAVALGRIDRLARSL